LAISGWTLFGVEMNGFEDDADHGGRENGRIDLILYAAEFDYIHDIVRFAFDDEDQEN